MRPNKTLYEYGRLRLGQTVSWNKLEYGPTNHPGRVSALTRVDGVIQSINDCFDVSAMGKVIQLEEVSTGCWVTVEFDRGATRSMHVDPDGIDRGGFGSLYVVKDSYQMEISI
jgi:hypothetical protein